MTDHPRRRLRAGNRPRVCRLVAAVSIMLLVAGCGAAAGAAHRAAQPAYDQALHNALPATIRDAGVLSVATDASYAPASFFDRDGHTIIGFEPDLAAALGHVLGVKVRFTNDDFESLRTMVAEHRTDAVLSAMTDTAEREKSVDFVNYFSAGTTIVVQRGNPDGISDVDSLCGRIVAVEQGTVQVDLLAHAQRNCPGRPIVVRAYGTNDDALVQLRTGRAAAVLNDYPPAAYLATDSRTRANYQLATTAQYEPGPYGIAVAKDRPQLRDALAAALDRLIRAGSYQAILRHWNVLAGAVTTASINAGAAAPTG